MADNGGQCLGWMAPAIVARYTSKVHCKVASMAACCRASFSCASLFALASLASLARAASLASAGDAGSSKYELRSISLVGSYFEVSL